MIVITKVSVVLCGLLMLGSVLQWIRDNQFLKQEQDILTSAVRTTEQERIQKERQRALEQKAAEEQREKVFRMDFKITHGSAFGGFCATNNEGRKKKGLVPLDHILLYGRHPSGKEFTYYIEDQNIEICAMDNPDELLVRSRGNWFEIRRSGQGRDEGILVQSAVIKRDILYYIILESRHEITIKAVKGC